MQPQDIVKDYMLVDPATQNTIIELAKSRNFGDQPDKPAHFLGKVDLPNGNSVPAFSRYAVDAILIDPYDNVVLITRRNNPGAGLIALPGGFIDPAQGALAVEEAIMAALREAMEETGIDAKVLDEAHKIPLGHRSFDRPFDIRVAWKDIEGTDIKKSDLFLVSTQGFLVYTQQDLSKLPLQAKDDAQALHIMKGSELKPEWFSVPDHISMIMAARKTVSALRLAPALPDPAAAQSTTDAQPG